MSSAAAKTKRLTELQARLREARDYLVELKTDMRDAKDRVKNIDAKLTKLENMERTEKELAETERLQKEKSTLDERINGLSLQVIPKAEAKIEKLEKDIDTVESGIGNYFTCI
jgi:chromosome condensin MukBEF ATPase and DNA-binding subunit MukB